MTAAPTDAALAPNEAEIAVSPLEKGTSKAPWGCPCGRCWWGLAEAHCPTCHQHFSSVLPFDRHRVGDYEPYTRRCLTAAEMAALTTAAGKRMLDTRDSLGGVVWVSL